MDKTYMDVEDLKVYQRLCKLHIEVCDLSHCLLYTSDAADDNRLVVF